MSDATHRPPREAQRSGRGRLIDFPRGGRGASRLPENNLPLQLTSFVGREREMAEVEGLLVGATRLLTLTGPGGSGKTRLALAVAADVMENFEDGVWWVELASLSDPDLVPQAVAGALGVREVQDRPLIETLCDHLGSKKMLLVLDNCEHLVGPCAALADVLLRTCPKLQILATSREALGISGESAWLVPPLVLPDAGQQPPVEELRRYEAIRLFDERARATASTFELTEHNAPPIARLCRRLDGMPLAIELAAARVKVLSVEQISSRLEDSFGLLRGGSRTALPRQQTLRATIDWSHDLLSEREQVLFRRLAVFAGGFTLGAAEEVCSGEDLEREEVLDLLSRLVDKSLVLVAERRGDEARYRLLETVRQYGQERLEESGETEAVRRRHADYFLALAEEAEPELMGPRQGAWLGRLETEHGNLRAALGWSLEGEYAELGLRLGGALGGFWHMRGHLSEGRRWLEAALASSPDAPPRPARAKALARAGWIAWEQGDYERSINLNEESLTLYRKAGDEAGVALALHTLGMAEMHRNERERSSALIEEAITLQRALGDSAGMARSLVVLGLVAVAQGEYERAAALHEESVELAREAGDDYTIITSLMVGAFAYLGRGEYRRARALCEEGLKLCRRGRMMHLTASHLHVSAVLAGSQGEPARSARLWGAAEALREAISAYLSPIERSFYDPFIAAVRTQLGEEAFTAAWSEGRTMSPEQALEYALAEVQEPGPLRPTEPASLPMAGPASAEAKAPVELGIFALGAARVEMGGHTLTPSDFGYAKPKELLFYLLCHPPRTKEQIGLALWPEASTSQLRGSFHEALRRLRKALGRAGWISFTRGRYSFNRSLGGYFFDVEAFETKLAEARKLKEESPTEAISHLKEAVGLYRGDFLEDFASSGGEWALTKQEELRRSYQDALLDLGVLLFSEDNYSEAAEAYRKVIAMDRYSEAAHRELMRCEAASGERGRALGHYVELVELLRKELGSTPAPETVALYEGVLRGEEEV